MQSSTHFNNSGEAVMVDVGGKEITQRTATATGQIKMNATAFEACHIGNNKKGDVLAVARIAGIMATKQTPNIIPLCHTIAIEKAEIAFALNPDKNTISATCTVKCSGKTGVEMEALCGVSAALLTIYDMLKSVDRGMEIGEIKLLHKQGGESGEYSLC